MTQNKVEYGPQPAYNEYLVPACPPSYSEALCPDNMSSPHKPVYPVPPVIPPQNYAAASHLNITVPQSQVSVPVCVGPASCSVTCPNCHQIVKTKIKCDSQKSAHIACCLLCLFGCFLCSCIPYCMKSFQNINHYCPLCNGYVGVYKS